MDTITHYGTQFASFAIYSTTDNILFIEPEVGNIGVYYALVVGITLNLLVVPKQFFIPNIIERRKPLSETARRAGWTGCNILLEEIPHSGRIYLVKNRVSEPKEAVLAGWQRTLFLRDKKDMKAKGWLLDVMRCIEKLSQTEFKLVDIYKFESELSKKHPENQHIKEKIRQQLQTLRDNGYLEFSGKGCYRKRGSYE